MAPVVLLDDEIYLRHLTGGGHPESPDRLRAIHSILSEAGAPDLCRRVEPREASDEEIALVHSTDHIRRLAADVPEGHLVYLDPDTPLSHESYRVARMAVGGVLRAVDLVMEGARGLALPRPPGHHAERDRAMGFCLFNNVAVAARYAQRTLGAKKVLIADWDLHHGNGTQQAFYADPSVLYFSTHQFPYYPGSGSWEETGTGDGIGFTVNVPLPPGQGDAEYTAVYDRVLRPIALDFAPDLVLVSAGFDTYHLDPLGGMRVTEEGYRAMAGILAGIADTCCDGRICIVLEGGYHLEGLARSVKAVLETLLEGPAHGSGAADLPPGAGRIIERAAAVHGRRWPRLGGALR